MDYTDNDKVGLAQLNPNLQQLLKDLIGTKEFQQLQSSLDIHKNDDTRHLTQDDINKLEYSYNRIKETIDEDVGEMLTNFVTTVVDIRRHMENDVIHWTAVEKAEYKNILNVVRNAITQMESNISKYQLDTSSNYVGYEQFNELNNNVQEHIGNINTHIYVTERSKWNNTLPQAKDYADNILQAHKLDTISHTSELEKMLWTEHMNNTGIHASVTDLALIENHMQDKTIHITLEDQAFLRELHEQYQILVDKVQELSDTVNKHEALLERIQRSISILE